MVGSNFPYSEFLPKEGQARGVQIDIDGAPRRPALPDGGQPGRRQPATLRALIPQLCARPIAAGASDIEAQRGRWWRVLEARA